MYLGKRCESLNPISWRERERARDCRETHNFHLGTHTLVDYTNHFSFSFNSACRSGTPASSSDYRKVSIHSGMCLYRKENVPGLDFDDLRTTASYLETNMAGCYSPSGVVPHHEVTQLCQAILDALQRPPRLRTRSCVSTRLSCPITCSHIKAAGLLHVSHDGPSTLRLANLTLTPVRSR